MLKDLWVPLSGAIAQQRKVETIANNVANANTTAFKKDKLVFKEHLTAFQKGVQDIDLPNKEWRPKDFYKSYGAEHGKVLVDGSYTNFEQGQLTPTNNPLDLALNGRGFFEVETPTGVKFTRNGTFSISNDGFLVTNDGHYVLSQRGSSQDNTASNRRLSIQGASKLDITRNGDIYSSNKKIGSLSVVEFKDTNALRKHAKSYFINPTKDNVLQSEIKTSVNQGFLESSNVNAISEMSNLIKANRHFESIQNVIKAYDSISSKVVNDIAKF